MPEHQWRQSLLHSLDANLRAAGMRWRAERYAERVLKYAVVAALAVSFLVALYTEDFWAGTAAFFAAALFGLCAGYYYPVTRKNFVAGSIEKELPFALMALSVELNMDVPFEKSLGNLAREDYGLLSGEFSRVEREVQGGGASIPEALFRFAERIDSGMVKRAVSQLVSVYEQGGGRERGEPVRTLAKELLLRQKAESKAFSGKMAVFSLMFIAVSAIVPAFFQSIVVIGSLFMPLSFTPTQLLVVAGAVFPLADVIVLMLIRMKTPVFLRG